MRFAPDCRPAILLSALLALGSLYLSGLLAAVFVVLLGFVLWFSRDPERVPPEDADVWVVPADGKVVEVHEADVPGLGTMRKVGIFMSPLDVHVNRFPCRGTVTALEYVPGKKWMVFAPKASEENERMLVTLETGAGPVRLVQIAGFLARRIVCRLAKGDVLDRGARYGMIKLGSKVDVYVPLSVKLSVRIGDRVSAGQSALGVMGHENHEA
jgi:phosphatidylserine decarboxylase